MYLARVKVRLETGDVMSAASEYQSVMTWCPPGASADLYYSRAMSANVRRQKELMLAVKAWQETVQAGIRATQLAEDRQNAFYHLASVYALVNDRVDAEASLRASIACAPNWFKPHWMLAELLSLDGMRQEALVEAGAAVERDASKHPEVVNTQRKLLRVRLDK